MTDYTTLYRHWDVNDVLLYVGISGVEKERRKQHRRESPWWPLVSKITTEHYDLGADADRAETKAINTERPLCNVNKVTDPRQKEEALALRSRLRRGGRPSTYQREPYSVPSMFIKRWSDSATNALRASTCDDCGWDAQWIAQRVGVFVALCSRCTIDEWVYAPAVAERWGMTHYGGEMWLRVRKGLDYVSRKQAGA